jgi:hypothetical protein
VGAEITTYRNIGSFTYLVAKKDSYTDTTYTVTLSTAAEDTAGNHLRFPLVFSFSTVQSAVTIYGIQTNPMHGDVDVDLIANSGIRVTFPRRMNGASVEAALTMSPEHDPILLWPQLNQLTIYTGGPLYADTTYNIHIDSTAEDLDGVTMGEDFEFSFRTRPVVVTSTSPQRGQLFVSRNTKITLHFDTYVVLESVRRAFSIEPYVSGSFTYGYDYPSDTPNVVTFIPSGTLRGNAKYTVTVSTEVEDLHGDRLKAPYEFSFVTRP